MNRLTQRILDWLTDGRALRVVLHPRGDGFFSEDDPASRRRMQRRIARRLKELGVISRCR